MKNQSNVVRKVRYFILTSLITTIFFAPACEDSPASSPSPIVKIFPWDGMTVTTAYPNLVIQFNKSLSDTGVVSFANVSYSVSGINCTMTLTTTALPNDTVILDPSIVAVEFTGTRTSIQIFSFDDSEGNELPVYTDTNYTFTAPVP